MKDDPYTYVGYEPADGLSKFGQQHGVNIVHDFFKGETAAAADAIVIDNVLEHVLDPQRLLSDAVIDPSRRRAGGRHRTKSRRPPADRAKLARCPALDSA